MLGLDYSQCFLKKLNYRENKLVKIFEKIDCVKNHRVT